jgi:hypothetical protein
VLLPQHASSLVALAVLVASYPSAVHAQALARERRITVGFRGLASADLELRAPDGQVAARTTCRGPAGGESEPSDGPRCRLPSGWWRDAGTYTLVVRSAEATREVAFELDGNELEIEPSVFSDNLAVHLVITRRDAGLRVHVADGDERRVYLVNETSTDLLLTEWYERGGGSTPWSFTNRDGDHEHVIYSGIDGWTCGNAIYQSWLPAYAIGSRQLQPLRPDFIDSGVREGRYPARIAFGRIDVTADISVVWVATFQVEIRVETSGELIAVVLPSSE